QLAVDAHHRAFDAVGMVVHRRQRPALRARVAVGLRVIRVAAHPDDFVARDFDQDAADRRADPAEALDRPDLGLGHRPQRPNTGAMRPRAAELNVRLTPTYAGVASASRPSVGSLRAWTANT